MLHDGATEFLGPDASLDDPAVFDVLADYFGLWVGTFEKAVNVDKAFVEYITRVQSVGMLRGEATCLFLRVATNECITGYVRQAQLGAAQSLVAYAPIDALAQLIVCLTSFHAKNQVGLLHKMLLVIVLEFVSVHPLPGAGKTLYRLMNSVLHLLQQAAPRLGQSYIPTLTAFAESLSALQPSLFLGYTHAWMALISHRAFLPPLLSAPDAQGWESFYALLQAQVRLLALVRRVPSATSTAQNKTSIYLGAMRIFLLLLHDFPEFLSYYAVSLCDLLPREFVQLRNVLLCAYPRQMRLPDPLDPNVDLALLTDAGVDFTSAPATLLSQNSPVWAKIEALVDGYFASDAGDASADAVIFHILGITTLTTPTTVASDGADSESEAVQAEQAARLEKEEEEALLVTQPILNSFVDDLARRVAHAPREQDQVVLGKALTVLTGLASRMDPHRSYLLLSGLANQLRFPSASMRFASELLVQLGTRSGDNSLADQILRVLLERIVVMRPHPWGILYTMARLMRSQIPGQVSVPVEIQRILENIQGSLALSYPPAGVTQPPPATPAPAPL